MAGLAGRFVTALRGPASNALRGSGIGAAAGGILGGGASLVEDAMDRDFNLGDFGRDVGIGALSGGLTGGLGGSLWGAGRGGRALGSTVGILGGLGAIGNAFGIGDDDEAGGSDFGVGRLGGLINALNSVGGGAAADTQAVSPLTLSRPKSTMPGGFFENYWDGVGPAPGMSVKSLQDWQRDPNLNKLANAQIIAANAATMREIEGVKNARDTELQANEALNDEYQVQAGQIARENAQGTKGLVTAFEAAQNRIDDETDDLLRSTGAASAGGQEYADREAQLEARQNDADISDHELLERLGVASQAMLGDLRQAENLQSKNNAVKIRTSANDQVSELRRDAGDRWKFEKPTILGTLAQGAMDSEMKQRQMGLQAYQVKMQQAQAMREAQQQHYSQQDQFNTSIASTNFEAQNQMRLAEMEAMAEAQKNASSGGIGSAQLYGDSGLTAMNESSGQADKIPEYALMDWTEASRMGVPKSLWDRWQPVVQALFPEEG